MSCWVVPSVAAEFWGVSVDVVWDRINGELVPCKTEDGFIFVDVDPWGPSEGAAHIPPPTFESAIDSTADGGPFEVSLDPAESRLLMRDLPPLRGTSIYPEEIRLITGAALDDEDEPVGDSFRELDSSSFELTDEEAEQLEAPSRSATAVALRENDSNDSSYRNDESDEDSSSDEELPELDDEESATFTRLSWQDVRKSVGRTRKPPPRS